MSRLRNFRIPLTIAFALFLTALCSGQEKNRVALSIGVDHYHKLGPNAQLSVAAADARRIKETLESLKNPFDVTLVENANFDTSIEAIESFIDSAKNAECALVYFAGHGIEYHGSNFLLPSDIDVGGMGGGVERTKRVMARRAIDLQHLLDDLEATRAAIKIVILDACRDNPLLVSNTDGNGTRSFGESGGGLASVVAPSGMLVAYSANVGEKANDGLFTEILCRNMKAPGARVLEVFAKTREEVMAKSQELAETNPGAVVHIPAEYIMLTPAGLKFRFEEGGGSEEESWADEAKDRELEELRSKIASMEAEEKREESEELVRERARLMELERKQQEEARKRAEAEMLRMRARTFEVVYSGSDGVNIRSKPNGTLMATLYGQSKSSFDQVPGSNESFSGSIPWILGSMEGWMAIRKITRGYDYAVSNGDGSLTMIWDGDGDPNDAFIALRSSLHNGTRLAKMYRGAKLVVVDGSRRTLDGYEWIKVRLVGWAAQKSPKGTALLRER